MILWKWWMRRNILFHVFSSFCRLFLSFLLWADILGSGIVFGIESSQVCSDSTLQIRTLSYLWHKYFYKAIHWAVAEDRYFHIVPLFWYCISKMLQQCAASFSTLECNLHYKFPLKTPTPSLHYYLWFSCRGGVLAVFGDLLHHHPISKEFNYRKVPKPRSKNLPSPVSIRLASGKQFAFL